MGRYFGREPRYSREEIEQQAQQAIEARVAMGRPPAEDWAPIYARLAELDREMVARAPVQPLPAPPPRREVSTPMSVVEVRLPPGATKAGRAPRPAVAVAAAPKARASRRPVAAQEPSA